MISGRRRRRPWLARGPGRQAASVVLALVAAGSVQLVGGMYLPSTAAAQTPSILAPAAMTGDTAGPLAGGAVAAANASGGTAVPATASAPGLGYGQAGAQASFPGAAGDAGAAGAGGTLPLVGSADASASGLATAAIFPASSLSVGGAEIAGVRNGATAASGGVQPPVTSAGGATTPAAATVSEIRPAGGRAALCVEAPLQIGSLAVSFAGVEGGCVQASALIQIGPAPTAAGNAPASSSSTTGAVALCVDGSSGVQPAIAAGGCAPGATQIEVGPATAGVTNSADDSKSVTVAPQSLTSDASLCVEGSGAVSAPDPDTSACAPGATQISVGPAASALPGATPSQSSATMLCIDASGNVTSAGPNAPGSTCGANAASIQVGLA